MKTYRKHPESDEIKVLKVYNPNNLPTLPYTQLIDFQGDLKHPIEPDALEKMRNSLKKHGVFVPKFVWFDDAGNANILDGHQTKQGLSSLEADGWTILPIPFVKIEAASREDAAEKLLQINSEYAKINSNTTWLESLNFPNVSELLESIAITSLDAMRKDFADLGEIPSVEDIEKSEGNEEPETMTTFCPKCGFEYEIRK